MRTSFTSILLGIAVLSCAYAQGERPVLKLWPQGAPGETQPIGPERVLPTQPGQRQAIRLTDVSEPTLTLYRAPADKATGTAVLVAPGGGYNILAWDLEGTEIAEWLNSIGVTAILLKYRVPRRDQKEPFRAPLQDAQRALRLARYHAPDWGFDPHRLGMLGFSAGGHLTVLAGTHWDQNTYEAVDEADQLSCRPDFLIPIYPAYLGEPDKPWELSPHIRVTKQTPPAFIAITYDDQDRGAQAALLLVEFKKHGVPAELHVFLQGGHGYGLRPSERPVSQWPKLCEQWMRELGLLERPASKPAAH